ncbi:MAG: fructose-1,6-bisphosphatase [Chloroflexota bacterium]|nr:fructose-1,6-bisphosphatase [Chloroflexota bacterium]
MPSSRPTLTDYIDSAWGDDPAYRGLHAVVAAIAEGTRLVQEKVQAAAIADVLGTTGDVNVQGEVVQILDEQSSDIFVDVLSKSGAVAAVGSEEIAEGVIVGHGDSQRYIVLMDPLDGSSNIDVAVSIGSIFGIWKREPGEDVTADSMLSPGSKQVAAVYAVYGSSTVFVVATEAGVQGFTLDTGSGAFELTHPDIGFPAKCQYYSVPDGYYKNWDDPTRAAATMLRDGYSLRYVGSLVADFHRNLLKGGIFWYPADDKSPNGKLRLMYEANPLGFVAEQAGGAASSGRERILDIQPEALHQRVPLMLGPADVVERTVSILNS